MKSIKTLAAALMLLAMTSPVLAQGDRANPPRPADGTRPERAMSEDGHRPPPPRGERGMEGRGEMGPPPMDREGDDMGERDGKRGFGFGRGEPPLREDQTEEALEVLSAFDPEAAAQLTEMVKTEPDKARNLIVRRVPFIARLMQMKKDDPEGFELRAHDYRLDKQARALAEKYRQAKEADKADEAKATLAELKEVVATHFKVRQEMREQILVQMEKRLQEMREGLKQREGDQTTLIAQRVDELVGNEAGYRW